MLLLLIGLSNCKKEESPFVMEELTPNNLISLPATRSLKVAVISNTEYLDPSLMIDCISEGSDFMKELSQRNVI
jgi:hypothetical protein